MSNLPGGEETLKAVMSIKNPDDSTIKSIRPIKMYVHEANGFVAEYGIRDDDLLLHIYDSSNTVDSGMISELVQRCVGSIDRLHIDKIIDGLSDPISGNKFKGDAWFVLVPKLGLPSRKESLVEFLTELLS